MAAFKFFNIGKANEEIARLEGEVSRLTAENASLAANTPEAVTNLQAQLATAETTIKELKASLVLHGTDAAALTAAKAEIEDLKTKLEAKGKEVEASASRKALEIVAGAGAPPAPVAPVSTVPAPKKVGGLKAVEAAFAAQINPVKN